MTNEEIVLQIQSGVNRKENLEQLYKKNLPLIRMIVKPYIQFFEEDDLMQEAFIGLMKAADQWEENRGILFMSYASWGIKGELTYFNRRNRTKAIPEFMQKRIQAYRLYIQNYEKENLCYPCMSDVIEHLHIDSAQYHVLMKTIAEAEIVSLATVLEDNLTIEDTIADKRECYTEVIDACMKDSLWKQVDELPDFEKGYVYLKYQDEKTDEEIAMLKKVDVIALRTVKQKAMRKLRKKTQVRQIAREYGYEISSAVYDNSLKKFKYTQTSQVERLAVNKVFKEQKQEQIKKRVDAIMDEIFQII